MRQAKTKIWSMNYELSEFTDDTDEQEESDDYPELPDIDEFQVAEKQDENTDPEELDDTGEIIEPEIDPEDVDSNDSTDLVDTDECNERERELDRLTTYLPNIGPTRAEALYDSIGGFEAVLKATRQELERVDGIGDQTAETIYYPVTDELARRIDDTIDDDPFSDDARAEPVEVMASRLSTNVSLDDFQVKSDEAPEIWVVTDEEEVPPEWAVTVMRAVRDAGIGDYDSDEEAVVTDDGRYVPASGRIPDDVPAYDMYAVCKQHGWPKWEWKIASWYYHDRTTVSFGDRGMLLDAELGPHSEYGREYWLVRYVPDDGYDTGDDDDKEENEEEDDGPPVIRLS
jgi:hypothetical protein